MKKKTLIIFAAAVVIFGGGLIGIFQLSASPASASLSEEEVLDKVKNQFPGEVMEFELDDQRQVYEVEIEEEGREYELVLDAESGEIVNLEERESDDQEEVANQPAETKGNRDDGSSANSSGDDDQDDQPETAKGEERAAAGSQTEAPVNNSNAPLSTQEAREIAMAEVNGQILEMELDEEDGYLHYEIEMRTEKNEVDLDIDAYTGEVLAVSYDDLDD